VTRAGQSAVVPPQSQPVKDLTGCGPTQDVYRVEQSRLVLIHKETIS
jgi:hypothetical protein